MLPTCFTCFVCFGLPYFFLFPLYSPHISPNPLSWFPLSVSHVESIFTGHKDMKTRAIRSKKKRYLGSDLFWIFSRFSHFYHHTALVTPEEPLIGRLVC